MSYPNLIPCEFDLLLSLYKKKDMKKIKETTKRPQTLVQESRRPKHQLPDSVRLAYQPPANSTFLSEQTSHQQPASSTFLSEQTSTSHQPPAKRTSYWPFLLKSTSVTMLPYFPSH
jgi:hypothetical protein